jgi:hypothetical protein
VIATASRFSRRKKPAKSAPAMRRIVQARKPGSKPYPSLTIPKAPPDAEADRRVRAFFKKMMPDHPMLHDDN